MSLDTKQGSTVTIGPKRDFSKFGGHGASWSLAQSKTASCEETCSCCAVRFRLRGWAGIPVGCWCGWTFPWFVRDPSFFYFNSHVTFIRHEWINPHFHTFVLLWGHHTQCPRISVILGLQLRNFHWNSKQFLLHCFAMNFLFHLCTSTLHWGVGHQCCWIGAVWSSGKSMWSRNCASCQHLKSWRTIWFKSGLWKQLLKIISVNISDNIQSIIYSLHFNVAQHLFQPYLHAILHQVLASGDSAISSVVHFASGKRMPWSPGLLWIDGASQTGSGWVSMHLIPNIVSILECWKDFSWFSQNYRTLSAPR